MVRGSPEGSSRVPTVVRDGPFDFKVYPREQAFEPPHVHVWYEGRDVCRINLDTGDYMDPPPPRRWGDIMEAYARHAGVIWAEWDRIHPGEA
jgi:hypothetical protein